MEIAITWDGDRIPLAKALVAAQKATEAVKKAASNPAFKSKYADLSHVVEAVVPALNEAGICVMQFPVFNGEMVAVTTTFLHEGGASVTSTLALRPSKMDPQGVGSAITYGRRYALLAMTGAAPEDDDGNAASGPVERQADAWEPSAGARTAVNTLETYQRDRQGFTDFWNLNKAGLKAALDERDYAWVIENMKRIAGTMPKAAPEPVKSANGHQAAVDALAGDEIPF